MSGLCACEAELGRWFVFLHPFPFAQPPHTTRARPSSFRTTEHDNTPWGNVTRVGAEHHGSCSPQRLEFNGRCALSKLQAPNVTTPTDGSHPIWICGRGASAHKSHSNFSVPQMQLCIKKVNNWNFGKCREWIPPNNLIQILPGQIKKESEIAQAWWFGIHRYLNGSGWALAQTEISDRPAHISAEEYYLIPDLTAQIGPVSTHTGPPLFNPTRSDSLGILCSVIEGCFCIGTALPGGVGPCVRAAPQSAAAGENRPSFCWAVACLLPAFHGVRPFFS